MSDDLGSTAGEPGRTEFKRVGKQASNRFSGYSTISLLRV
jgi:hypothetical protein